MNRQEKLALLKSFSPKGRELEQARIKSLDLSPSNLVNISTEDLENVYQKTTGRRWNDGPQKTADEVISYLENRRNGNY